MSFTTAEHDDSALQSPKARDSVRTRQLLLHAARRRFARDGYSATTVRQIAADAGVNVALINRYFASKEGLFEACLARAVEQIDRVDDRAVSFDDLLMKLVEQVAGGPTDEHQLQLLLLLRSSGDENADQIRRRKVRSYAEGIARIAGWRPGDESSEHLLVRAEIALATCFGMVLLRTSTGVEPLSAAGVDDLAAPLTDVFRALLAPPPPR